MPDDGSRKKKKAGDKAKKQPQVDARPGKSFRISLFVLFGALIAVIGVIAHQCKSASDVSTLQKCLVSIFDWLQSDGDEIKEQIQTKSEHQNQEDVIYWRDVIAGIEKDVSDDAKAALEKYEKVLGENPTSLEALFGKAKALDVLAEKRQSNAILQKAIASYLQLINSEETPSHLLQAAAERCVNRMQFIGHYGRAIAVHRKLIGRFPDVSKYYNNLAVAYLTINNINEAKKILEEALERWPNSGVALVHYGFILKTAENKLEEAVDLMKRGIASKEAGVVDGRFYFHLGDALARLGRNEEAMALYEEGVANGLFLSKYQRSLYNVKRLKGRPWWQPSETPYGSFFKLLEGAWEKIRDEGMNVLNERGYFQDESENLRDSGDWKQFELFSRGAKNVSSCRKCPFTCKLIESHPDARGCRRGQTKFSVMHPGTHVWAHCGPTNCRIRAHLGLKVPENTFIRVAEETRSWKEGKVLVFDDSFEHEVWHNGSEPRLVLIVDLWHPEVTEEEKKSLSPI